MLQQFLLTFLHPDTTDGEEWLKYPYHFILTLKVEALCKNHFNVSDKSENSGGWFLK